MDVTSWTTDLLNFERFNFQNSFTGTWFIAEYAGERIVKICEYLIQLELVAVPVL